MTFPVTKPIFISGFGRSGTTWLSDILSKTLGGLILFEPFHPTVFEKAKEFCYKTDPDEIEALKLHLSESFSVPPINPWLLRNHLPTPIEKCTPSYLHYVWRNSKVIGCKVIRANHIISNLANELDGKVIHIVRNPMAVVASIQNRSNFWKEFDWDWHHSAFIKRALSSAIFSDKQKQILFLTHEKSTNQEEKILFMWSVSLMISLGQMSKCDSLLVDYESLYVNPFQETSKILKFLNKSDHNVHPSYFFTPSMTSLETMHSTFDLDKLSRQDLDDIFWKNRFSKNKVNSMRSMIESLVPINENFESLLRRLSYL